MKSIVFILILVGNLLGNVLQTLDLATAFCNDIDIRELTISRTHQLYEKNLLTPSQLTQCYLNRIDAMNPHLNAVLETSPMALREAKKLDGKYYKGRNKELFGIPILIKDCFGTRDGMENTSGSEALLGIKPKNEAMVVTILKRAGAIILGKTNLSELSGFISFTSPEGWSTRGNQTTNPYKLSESPRGSSSGSAVAVATNLCSISLGVELEGSIHLPSMASSVVGFKFTTHSVSMRGIIPLAPSQEALGIISRSVQDNQKVFETFQTFKHDPNYPNSYNWSKKKFRLGVVDFDSTNLTDVQLKGLKHELGKFNSSQVVLIDEPVFHYPDFDFYQIISAYAHEFKYAMNQYLKNEVIYSRGNKLKNFRSLLQFYEKRNHPFGLNLLIIANSTNGLKSKKYKKARLFQAQARQAILKHMSKYRLDAIAAPGLNWNSFSLPALAGFPSISIPAGIDNDLPFSLVLYAPSWRDSLLFDLASKLESVGSLSRHIPQFLDNQ